MKNFYDEFYNEMKHNAYFAKMELKKVEVPKNNHMAQAVTVLRPGEAIAPTIYPEQFFQEYMQGTSVTRIVQNLADTMQRNSVKQYASSAEAYLSFIKKENLRSAVVNYENNKEWLKDVPHERFLDLAVFAKVDMGEPGMSMKFNNWLLSRIQMTKEEVLQLEKELSFQEFNNHAAYQLGQIIVDHIEKNHLKNVRIRIVLDGDIVFQYLMDGKKGVIWLDRKQKTVEKYGHSSYYIYLENEENKTYQDDEKDESLVICGGGFPLIIQNELRGSILVSGLVHDEDHQVIVDCLRELKDDGTCK